ncbi:sulfite exporter TauE/SafE family protein [Candidatus Acetothermia bacterium]|nr:MAG: sulfite exporter TauE/SafE family protein [Candidatus Acetothermia bacterium]
MPVELWTFLPLFFAAIGIGFLASLLGLGGGVFMVPLLSLGGFVATMPEAAGTSLAAIVFTSISSSIAYYHRRAIDLRIGLLFMPSAIGGIILGAWLTEIIDPKWLMISFGVFLFYPVGMMITGKSPKEIRLSFKGEAIGGRLYAFAALLGLIAGIVSGMFGIGGGTVFVPSLAVFLGLDIVTAVATSLFVMIPTTIIGAAKHWMQGNLHMELALPLILGIIIGTQIGPRIGSKIPKKRLRQLFGIVLLYAAVNMIVKGFR